MKKLLLIDDDADFLESNRLYFSKRHYAVFCQSDPYEALSLLASLAMDCIILDIDMPQCSGLEVCRKIRSLSAAPVIFVSGMADAATRIASFRVGGDDFLAKPYDIVELELRIQARIRKNEQVFFSDSMRFGDLCIDQTTRTISYRGTMGDFSALQFDIVALLARNPSKVFSYEQLYQQVWNEPILNSRHNLQVAVATVRQKLARLCGGRQSIRTGSRRGYCFYAEEAPPDDPAADAADKKA